MSKHYPCHHCRPYSVCVSCGMEWVGIPGLVSPPAPKWLPIDTKPEGVMTLVFHRGAGIQLSDTRIAGDRAWMPLPKPPVLRDDQ